MDMSTRARVTNTAIRAAATSKGLFVDSPRLTRFPIDFSTNGFQLGKTVYVAIIRRRACLQAAKLRLLLRP